MVDFIIALDTHPPSLEHIRLGYGAAVSFLMGELGGSPKPRTHFAEWHATCVSSVTWERITCVIFEQTCQELARESPYLALLWRLAVSQIVTPSDLLINWTECWAEPNPRQICNTRETEMCVAAASAIWQMPNVSPLIGTWSISSSCVPQMIGSWFYFSFLGNAVLYTFLLQKLHSELFKKGLWSRDVAPGDGGHMRDEGGRDDLKEMQDWEGPDLPQEEAAHCRHRCYINSEHQQRHCRILKHESHKQLAPVRPSTSFHPVCYYGLYTFISNLKRQGMVKEIHPYHYTGMIWLSQVLCNSARDGWWESWMGEFQSFKNLPLLEIHGYMICIYVFI